MKVVRLTADYELTEFDCGDSDLNEFLMEDAKHSLRSVLPIRSSLRTMDA